jgi:hypothetical protein
METEDSKMPNQLDQLQKVTNSETYWVLLFELEIPAIKQNYEENQSFNREVSQAIQPLGLPAETLDRLVISVGKAAAQINIGDEPLIPGRAILIRIFASKSVVNTPSGSKAVEGLFHEQNVKTDGNDQSLESRTCGWGYFLIARTGCNTITRDSRQQPCVELFLYPEGD